MELSVTMSSSSSFTGNSNNNDRSKDPAGYVAPNLPSMDAPEAPPSSVRNTAVAAPPSSSSSSQKNHADAFDEEIRMAQAMAMAMKTNPHLTPEEIRQLVGAPKSVVGGAGQSQVAPPKTMFAAGQQRFTHFFHTTGSSKASSPSAAAAGAVASGGGGW